jgi:hypothetical protein
MASDNLNPMKASLLMAGLLLAAPAFAQAPQQTPLATLPKDQHEGITLSVDAYTRVARGKDKFGKANPLAVGILPVEVFFKNDTNLPVKLDLNTIQLEVHAADGNHQDIDWLEPVEVASAVAHPGGPPEPKLRRFPVGVNIPKDEKRDKMLEILKPFAFDADILPPNATIHGFFFFDVGGNIPAPGDATFYVPDLTAEPSNKTLMFFEVALQNKSASEQ